MSEDEASAYLNRYADVQSKVGFHNIAGAINHWATRGQKEGRDKSVNTDLSIEESAAYLNRYADIKAEFGHI